VATSGRGDVGHGLGPDLMRFPFRTGDQDPWTEFIDRKLIHDREQLLLDDLRHIMFDGNTQSTFVPQLADSSLQRQ
jgi:hypothetical protein